MIVGTGAVINAAAICVGGIVGMYAGRLLKPRFRETILKILAFGVIMMAAAGTFARMLVVTISHNDGLPLASIDAQGSIMMILSLSLGALLGELIDLHSLFERLGIYLRRKTGSEDDTKFLDAFLSASFTVCIGAMAIIGSLQEGISGDAGIIFSKSLIDFVFILTLTASMGKGCIFASIPVLIIQGTITFLASFIAPIMTDAAVSNLSLVGNVLILCVGVNMLCPDTIRVANTLPAIALAVLFAFI